MDDLVLIDWLSITTKIHSPLQVISLLGMDHVTWQETKGAHGYRDRLYYNSISIHFNGQKDMGVWLEMSGQGCRCFETVGHGDFDMLCSLALSHPGEMKITRLDVAFDDHSGILPISRIFQDTVDHNFISKSEFWETVLSSKGTAIYHGSPQSQVRIRIYDKAAERNYTDGTHWIRVELQLRNDRCAEFMKKTEYDIGERFAGVILNYLRYVTPDPTDTNNRRWPLTDYWQDLVGAACRISIYTRPGMEYNLEKCKKYVFGYASNAIDAALQIYGVDGFLKQIHERKVKPNPKYDRLVEDYRSGVYGFEETT